MGTTWRGERNEHAMIATRVQEPCIRLRGTARGPGSWVWLVDHPDGRTVLLGYMNADAEFASLLAEHLFPAGEDSNLLPKLEKPAAEAVFEITDPRGEFIAALRRRPIASIARDKNGDLVFRSESGAELYRIANVLAYFTEAQIRSLVQRWRFLHTGMPAQYIVGPSGIGQPIVRPVAPVDAPDPNEAARARLREIAEQNASPAEGTLNEDGGKDPPEPLSEEAAAEVRRLLKEAGLNIPDTIATKPQGEES